MKLNMQLFCSLELSFAMHRSVYIFILMFTFAYADEYVKEVFQICTSTKDPYYCTKFRFLKFVEDFDLQWKNKSIVSLVRLSNEEERYVKPIYEQEDSEYLKLFKFLKWKILSFLSSYGLEFQLVNGVIDGVFKGRSLGDNVTEVEERTDLRHILKIKDIKKLKILSGIVLFKLLKTKVMLSGVLLVIYTIIKIMIFAALIYPTIYTKIIGSCEKSQEGWWG